MEENNTTLTVTDLINIQRIIEIAAERGAFKADELKDVGIIYERLKTFISGVTPPTDSATTQPTQGD